jgi:hypothetical protein
MLYRDDSGVYSYIRYNPESWDNRNTYYRLNYDLRLELNYDKPGNFDNIKLTVKNKYSTATYNINIEFEKDPSPDNGKKSAWYIYLIIAIVVVTLIGGGVYFYKTKRSAQIKK